MFLGIGNGKKGEVVVIGGKGDERYEEMGNESLDFDDGEVGGRGIVEVNKNTTN